METIFVLITNRNLNFEFIYDRSNKSCQRQHDGDNMKICFMHTPFIKQQPCQTIEAGINTFLFANMNEVKIEIGATGKSLEVPPNNRALAATVGAKARYAQVLTSYPHNRGNASCHQLFEFRFKSMARALCDCRVWSAQCCLALKS